MGLKQASDVMSCLFVDCRLKSLMMQMILIDDGEDTMRMMICSVLHNARSLGNRKAKREGKRKRSIYEGNFMYVKC